MEKNIFIFPAIILIALMFGCTGPQEVKRRYFWPPLPDAPKIEYVTSYWSADDFPPSAKRRFVEKFAGVQHSRGLDKPWGIASNGKGKIYVVDTNIKGVVVFDLKDQTVELLGMGKDPDYNVDRFIAPVGIALDEKGHIYVSDPKVNKVYVFSREEKPLMVIGGENSTLNWPVGMAVDDRLGRLYVVNSRGHNISVFDLEGKYLFSIGKRGSGDVEFNFPTDVDIDSKGNLVVADSMNARVQVLDPEGKFITKFGQRGDRYNDFQVIKGVAVSRSDDIYVVDGRSDRILVFNNKGEPLTVIGGTASVGETGKINPGGFLIPQDIDIDMNDTMYVVDSMNKRFQVFQIINEQWLREHPIN